MNTQKDFLLFFSMPHSYFYINECKKSQNLRGKTQAMEAILYTIKLFFSDIRFFRSTFRKIPYYFLVCSVSISRLMNANKKTRNLRGMARAMETHFYTLELFLSLHLSYGHSERFSYYFIMPP